MPPEEQLMTSFQESYAVFSCSQQAASHRQNDVKTSCLDVSNAAAPKADTCVSPSLLLNKMENL